MLSHEFMRNAYLAGTFIALACGVVGWFLVLRAQVFAGDALGHVAFVGAIAAACVGLDPRIGLFVLTLAAAVALAALDRGGRPDDVAIGTFFSWVLGIGMLLLVVLATGPHAASGITATNALFGSIFSLTFGGSLLAAAVGAAAAGGALLAFRPLLYSTLDPGLAALRGVKVRALGVAFLGLLAVVTAESAQAVGALLLLGLLAAPAGAAHRLTGTPGRGIAIAAGLAVASMWGGLALSYTISSLPPSVAIIGLAAAFYALTPAVSAAQTRHRTRTSRGTGERSEPESRLGGSPIPR
jgi:zinc/manganese transport system permease protein